MKSIIIIVVLFYLIAFLATVSVSQTTDCVTYSNSTDCVNYEYPVSSSESDIDMLCKMMSYMPVCSIQASCKKAGSTSGVCDPFSILGDSCIHDMPGMSGCSNYKKLCSSTSVVKECSSVQSIENLPTTMQMFAGIKSICNEMAMDGCEKCDGTSPTSTCMVLDVYSSLCMAMPDMSQCSNWTKLCSSNGNLMSSSISSDYCVLPVDQQIPIMRMYFHTGIIDYILFKSWVPRTNGEFAGAWFAIFFFSLFFELFKTGRSILEKKWSQELKKDSNSDQLIDSNLLKGSYPKFSYRDIIRGLLHGIENICSLALMLIAMIYNVALFFAVIAGVIIGTIAFGRFRNYTPGVSCCE